MAQQVKRPRVLHVQKFKGIYGSETHLGMLLPGLAAQGFDTDLLALVPPGMSFPEYFNTLKQRGVGVSIVPIRSHADAAAFSGVRRAVSRGCYDIVHTHLIHGDLYGIPAARICRVPHIITTKHGYDNYDNPSRLYKLDGLVCRGAEIVVTISDALQEQCLKVEGVPKSKMRTIYYGLDTARLRAEADSAPFDRAAHGLDPEHCVIATVGRLAPVKGYPYLLEAMRGVVDEHPEARLVIVGDGPDRGALESQCRSLGIENHVVFLGFRSDVPSILRDAQLAAYATLGEGFGLGVVEAMVQETPVVATHTMALPELVMHGEDGFLVPTADPPALRGRMLELIRSPDLRAAMGRRGLENVEKKFSMQTMIDNTAALYGELIRG